MIAIHTPHVVLRTPRLELSPLEHEEARSLVETGHLSGRRVADGYPTDATLVAAGIVITAAGEARDLGPFTTYLVARRADGCVVGDCGFPEGPAADGVVEIGYGIADSARDRGYGTEAVEALIGFALLQAGVRRVVAETTAANPASRRVLEKAGLKLLRERDGLLLFGT
jgi:[ribosomal protein S5]-alanine N-acetyltransferase